MTEPKMKHPSISFKGTTKYQQIQCFSKEKRGNKGYNSVPINSESTRGFSPLQDTSHRHSTISFLSAESFLSHLDTVYYLFDIFLNQSIFGFGSGFCPHARARPRFVCV
jgi:hypothetical protein